MLARIPTALIAFALGVKALAQAPVSGTVETFFVASSPKKGFVHRLSWAELNGRLRDNVKATLSLTELPNMRMLDEACLAFEAGPNMVRAGRIRTAFGLSDWSELYYNGFNHLPLIRLFPVVGGLNLLRSDSGIEITTSTGTVQVQAALIDTDPSRFQVLPHRMRHATARLQTAVGPAIIGANVLTGLSGDDRVFGLDFRWATTRFLLRGETLHGSGPGPTSSGYYLDLAYRIPKATRTQLVGRSEGFSGLGGVYRLQTVGVRHFVHPMVGLNLNYGWSTGEDVSRFGGAAPEGWTLQTMLRMTF
jgi:hypothetical protein